MKNSEAFLQALQQHQRVKPVLERVLNKYIHTYIHVYIFTFQILWNSHDISTGI